MKTKLPFTLLFSLFILMQNISSAQVIATGGHFSLAVCLNNTVQSWGDNGHGQLGHGNLFNDSIPVQVNFLTGIIAVAGCGESSLFLKNDSTVFACGRNDHGQLGDGSINDKSNPGQVPAFSTGIISTACGTAHSLFLKSDSTVWACGWNSTGEVGDGTNTEIHIPVQVHGVGNVGFLTSITSIAGGGLQSLFLKNDATVWACGWNQYGQLGDGSNTNRNTPVQVNGLSDITAIACGNTHSLFLKSDSTVWACGDNGHGQLGNGINTNSNVPVQVHGVGNIGFLTGIIAISGGGQHSLFLKNDGTVLSCGYNINGQLGDSSVSDRWSPVLVDSLTGITSIAAGSLHSLFLKNDGTVWACGWNSFGQLGDNTTTDKYIPVHITGLCPMITSIEPQQENGFQIYPNPTTGHFIISLRNNNKKVVLSITDITGKIIYTTTEIETREIKISTNDFTGGIYIVQIQATDFIETKKIIVVK